jgi:hypothetical protein
MFMRRSGTREINLSSDLGNWQEANESMFRRIERNNMFHIRNREDDLDGIQKFIW